MIVFTLRTNNTPKCYDDCLNNIAMIYNDIQVFNVGYRNEGEHAGWITDKLRLVFLSERWINEDVLYLDMDCVVNRKLCTSELKRPAFANNLGGYLDNWAIFKPVGYEWFFKKMVEEIDWTTFMCTQKDINSKYHSQVDIIYGYPHLYIDHLYLSKKYKYK